MTGTASTLDCAILIPVHNAERWLGRCLEAATAQPVRWILVIDDGSTDGSLGIISDWARRDSRICYQSNPLPRGACQTRNRLQDWALILGVEWLQFVDADDWLLTGKIARMIAQARPGSELLWCDLVRFEYSYFPPRRKVMRFIDPHGYGFPPNPGCWLIRRSLLERLPELRWDEAFRECRNDLDFWMTAISLGARTQRTPFVGFAYRAFWGPGQLTQNPARHEHALLEAKHPQWLLDRRVVIEEKTTRTPAIETHFVSPYDCPKTIEGDPAVLVDVSPFTEPEADWARVCEVLRVLGRRNVPLRVTVLWPWGAGGDRLRAIGVKHLTLASHPGGVFAVRVRSGWEDLPGVPVGVFDPPVVVANWRKSRPRELAGTGSNLLRI